MRKIATIIAGLCFTVVVPTVYTMSYDKIDRTLGDRIISVSVLLGLAALLLALWLSRKTASITTVPDSWHRVPESGKTPAVQPPSAPTNVEVAIAKQEGKATEESERTFVGGNITPRYLMNFFRKKHTTIQIKKLTEVYIGKWMSVNGTLDDVLSTFPPRAQLTFKKSNRNRQD